MLTHVLPLLIPVGVVLVAVGARRSPASGPIALGALSLMLMGAKPEHGTNRHELGISGATGRYSHACGGHSTFAGAGFEYRNINKLAGQTDGSIEVAAGASVIDGRTVPMYRLGVGIDHRWMDGAIGAFGRDFDPAEIAPGGRLRIGPEDVFSFEGRFGWERPAVYDARLLTVVAGPGLPALRPDWEKGRLMLGVAGLGTGGAAAFGGDLDLPLGQVTIAPSVYISPEAGPGGALPYWAGMNLRLTFPHKRASDP